MSFKIGDRVVYDGKEWNSPIGKHATIVCVPSHGTSNYGIETDDPSGGHSCSGLAKLGHGWWVSEFEGTTKVLHYLEEEIEMECDEDIDALLF